MKDRRVFLREYFLSTEFQVSPINKDLSRRYYFRVTFKEKKYILMESKFPEEEKFQEFVNITNLLSENKFRVPKIFSHDISQGFILEEDLGDNLFSVHLAKYPEEEDGLYYKALDILLELANLEQMKEDGFQMQTDELLLQGIRKYCHDLSLENYECKYLKEYFSSSLTNLSAKRNVLSLQDFHADNLFYGSDGRVGLIDYQDAIIGLASYDVVSLLQDARRYISKEKEMKYLKYYLSRVPALEIESFMESYKLLSLQRNLRIYGLFTEVVKKRGIEKYKQYIPNVEKYLSRSCDFVEDFKLSEIIKSSLGRT